jgi:hypothetical protein
MIGERALVGARARELYDKQARPGDRPCVSIGLTWSHYRRKQLNRQEALAPPIPPKWARRQGNSSAKVPGENLGKNGEGGLTYDDPRFRLFMLKNRGRPRGNEMRIQYGTKYVQAWTGSVHWLLQHPESRRWIILLDKPDVFEPPDMPLMGDFAAREEADEQLRAIKCRLA